MHAWTGRRLCQTVLHEPTCSSQCVVRWVHVQGHVGAVSTIASHPRCPVGNTTRACFVVLAAVVAQPCVPLDHALVSLTQARSELIACNPPSLSGRQFVWASIG